MKIASEGPKMAFEEISDVFKGKNRQIELLTFFFFFAVIEY